MKFWLLCIAMLVLPPVAFIAGVLAASVLLNASVAGGLMVVLGILNFGASLALAEAAYEP